MDTLDFTVQLLPSEETTGPELTEQIQLIINGTTITPLIDPRALLINRKISTIDLFTCSCGCPGCAGWHEGIALRYRKHTVEWRLLDDATQRGEYGLNRYYCFDKANYADVSDRVLDAMVKIDSSATDFNLAKTLRYYEWYYRYFDAQDTFSKIKASFNHLT